MASSSGSESSSSDLEAEFGQVASAHEQVPRTTLPATLQSRDLKKFIDEPDWHHKDRPDFHQGIVPQRSHYPDAPSAPASDTFSRAVSIHTPSLGSYPTATSVRTSRADSLLLQNLLEVDEAGVPDAPSAPAWSTSSRAVSIHTRSSKIGGHRPSSKAQSNYTPSFGSYPTARSGSSVRTSCADSLLLQNVLEEDEAGIPRAPSTENIEGRLACSYSFLACSFRTNNLEEWDTHCVSHFRGVLPKTTECPFYLCEWSIKAESGEEAWRCRVIHIVADGHSQQGFVDTNRRPKASLIDHLWRHRIIDDADKKQLIRHGRLSWSYSLKRSAGNSEARRNRKLLTGYRNPEDSASRAWKLEPEKSPMATVVHNEASGHGAAVTRTEIDTSHEVSLLSQLSAISSRVDSMPAKTSTISSSSPIDSQDLSQTLVPKVDSGYASMEASEHRDQATKDVRQEDSVADSDAARMLADLGHRLDTLLSRASLLSTAAASFDISSHVNSCGGLRHNDRSAGQSGLRRRRSSSTLSSRGQVSNSRANKRRTQSEPPIGTYCRAPQISMLGPRGNYTASKVQGLPQSSGQSNKPSRNLHSAKGNGHFNQDDGNSPGGGGGQPPPSPDPSSNPFAGESKHFPCLNRIGEPEAFRHDKFSCNHISGLMRHMKTHHFYACENCVVRFDSEIQLETHKDLPHTLKQKCRSTKCRRYRADPQNSGNFECGSCLRSSESQFQALLLLKYPYHGQQSPSAAGIPYASPEHGSDEGIIMDGVESSVDESLHELYFGFGNTNMNPNQSQQFDYITTPAPPVRTVALHQIEGTNFVPADGSFNHNGQQTAVVEPEPEFGNGVLLELLNKANTLEELLNRAESHNSIWKCAFDIAWKELVRLGSHETLPSAPLYNLVKIVAPNVVSPCEVGSQIPRQSPANASLEQTSNRAVTLTTGRNNGKQKQQSADILPRVVDEEEEEPISLEVAHARIESQPFKRRSLGVVNHWEGLR